MENTKAVYESAELLTTNEIDQASIRNAIRDLLEAFGEDPKREGLKRTPDRVARMYTELLEGYRQDPHALVNDALFEVKYDEMVLTQAVEFNIPYYHHLVIFHFK